MNYYLVIVTPIHPSLGWRCKLHAYLADFGLGKLITTSTSSVGSKSGQSGTPGFQSPELLKAKRVDVLADVYSFGCVLIELFGEKQVWCGVTHFQIMYKVGVELQPPEHDHLPEKIWSICASCISQHDHRATAMQVLKALLQSAGIWVSSCSPIQLTFEFFNCLFFTLSFV